MTVVRLEAGLLAEPTFLLVTWTPFSPAVTPMA